MTPRERASLFGVVGKMAEQRDWYNGKPASEDGAPQQESIAERQASERDETNSRHEAEIKAMDKRHAEEIVGEPPHRYLERDKSLDKGIVRPTPSAPDLSVSDPGRPYRTQRLKDIGATDRT